MQKMMQDRARELLSSGKVDRVLGWIEGDFVYDVTPHVFRENDIDQLIYHSFAAQNLSKYLVGETKKDGVIAVFLRPCDSYSFVQLLKEHRFDREKVYAIAIPCLGKVDAEDLRAMGIRGITGVTDGKERIILHTLYGDVEKEKSEVIAERCRKCRGVHAPYFDERLGEELTKEPLTDRFEMVEKLEKMTAEERFAFWQGELSRCIRCNACRNVCPACTCEKCVFDNAASGIENKAPASSFEEQNFHIIRAFHVAGRCTDCGQCSRVCPQGIPLHLLNRKFIKDINSCYGEYRAGADLEEKAPLNRFDVDDCEPGDVVGKGE